MKTIVFGFKSEKIQNAIERELAKANEKIHKVTKLTPRAVKEYLDKNPLTNAVVLLENGEEYQWNIDEICALTDAAEVNVIIVIDESHRNTDYMQQLYRAGITSAIFFQEKKGGISPATVARLVLRKRSRKEAREYYGIEVLKNTVSLDETVLSAGYKSLADNTFGRNIMERYLKIAETMTAKQNLQFFKKMPRKLKSQIVKYEEFYDFQNYLKDKGVNLGVRKPRKGLLSMEAQEEESEEFYIEEPVRVTDHPETPDSRDEPDISEKTATNQNQKVVVFAEIVDTIPEEGAGTEENFYQDEMDFSEFEEEMKKEAEDARKELFENLETKIHEEYKQEDISYQNEEKETVNEVLQSELYETEKLDDTTDFATLFSDFSEESSVEEEKPEAYEELEEDFAEEPEEEENGLSTTAMIGIGICAVAVIIVIIVIVFVVSSANRSNAAMSRYIANEKTAEIVNDVENEELQTAEEDAYEETEVETSTENDTSSEDLVIVGGDTDEESTTVTIETTSSDNQNEESTENSSQNQTVVVQQTATQDSVPQDQNSQTTTGSSTENTQTQTANQTSQAENDTEEETADNVSNESAQESAYKNKVLNTGDVYSGLEVLNYINANVGSYKIIGNDLEKTCSGGDVSPGDVVLSGSYQVTVKDTGMIIFLLQ
ncbi:MAG: hypothetical protein IJN92_03830 [Lachnospiraceae bacterium]|nr:hypothetical protein [Lachnospiraceae bacterium]